MFRPKDKILALALLLVLLVSMVASCGPSAPPSGQATSVGAAPTSETSSGGTEATSVPLNSRIRGRDHPGANVRAGPDLQHPRQNQGV